MLVNFSVTNFLSFNQKTTFSMESGRVTKKTDHLLIDQNTGKSLLKFSAMYGKNGAGKTNFIRAVSVLRNFILTGKLPQRAPILWCRLQDENEVKPTDFEIEFIAEKKLYCYKISVVLSTGKITNEELVSIVGNRHTKLFYRESEKSPYVFHHSIKGKNSDIEVLSRTFGMNDSPFLFSINHNTGGFFNTNPQAEPLQKAFFWFKNTLEVIFPDQPLQETSLLRYKVCKNEFSRLLKEFDTGIEEIKIEPVSKEKVFENLDARTQQKLNLEMVLFTPFMQLQNLPPKDEQQKVGSPKNEIYYSTVIRNRRNIFIITSENDKMFHFYAKKFVHNIGGNKIEFSLEDKQVRIDKVLDQNYMDNVWGGVPVFKDEESKE